MHVIFVAAILIAIVGVVWWHKTQSKITKLSRDPKAFHAWAIECVSDARSVGVKIPPLILQYLSQQATKDWALAAGLKLLDYPDEQIDPVALIEDAESAGLEPLMRYQVSLGSSDKLYFEQAIKER